MRFSTLRIAWRNLWRSKRRTLLAVLAIAVGQFALLATNGLMHGYADNIRLALTGPMIGHVQVHHPRWREERAMDLVVEHAPEAMAAVRRDPMVMNAGGRIYAPVLVAPKRDAFTAVVVGVEVAVESQSYGLLSGLDEPLQPGRVLLGHLLARRIKARPGDEIAVVGQAADGSIANDLYVVQDVIRGASDLVNQSGVVMALDDAQALLVMPDRVHEIVIRASRSGESEGIAARTAAIPALAGMEVLPWTRIVPELVVLLEMADYTGYFVLVLVFIAAIAGIANTLMMSTFERMHEFGMLLALGSRPVRLVRMIVAEALLIGVLGVVVGTALGYGFVAGTQSSGVDMASWGGNGEMSDLAYKGLTLPLHVYPRVEAYDTFVGFIAVMITSLLASVWPASIAARLEPMEAMRR